jgi:hypothetical protein
LDANLNPGCFGMMQLAKREKQNALKGEKQAKAAPK